MIGLARRLHATAVIAASAHGQRRVPFEPREKLEARRDRRIRRIVAHAARTVPYYREWFRSEGVDPREINGARELEQLPILDRELIRGHPDLFLSESHSSRGALSFATSGTTGTPLRVRHDRRSLLANIGFGERERQPVIDLCGGSFRPSELYVGYETSTFKKVTAFYQQNALMPIRPRRHFVSLTEPVERVAEILDAERPDVLVGYGGWIDLFFNTITARSIAIERPKLVMYMGEALPPGARRKIEEDHKVPVMSRYNAVEAFKIGFYCERRTGFHLHEDLCCVRVVRADGRAADPGEPGEVVLSNLLNRATVLLNYPLGDIASLPAASCPCGRTFRLLSELEGRREDIISLPHGGVVHPRSVWEVFKGDRDVLQYQLVQRSSTRFELRLATTDAPSYERAVTRAMPRLQSMLGATAAIEAQRRTEVHLPTHGKFRAVASQAGALGATSSPRDETREWSARRLL